MSVVDEYELKARTAPGLIVALPIIADVLLVVPSISNWGILTASGVCGVALIYGLGRVAQARGEKIEQHLWNSWGGPPSTRFIRDNDTTFTPELKQTIRDAVRMKLSATLPKAHSELKNGESADQVRFDVFRRVRQYLRMHDPRGLWHRHNIEYGFCRNLLGCRQLWLAVASIATVMALAYGVRGKAGIVNPASAVGLLSTISAAYLGWWLLPGATKRCAENYAESAWMSFIEIQPRKVVRRGIEKQSAQP